MTSALIIPNLFTILPLKLFLLEKCFFKWFLFEFFENQNHQRKHCKIVTLKIIKTSYYLHFNKDSNKLLKSQSSFF